MKTKNFSKSNLNISDILVSNFGIRFGENINICMVDVEDYIFPSFSQEKILFQYRPIDSSLIEKYLVETKKINLSEISNGNDFENIYKEIVKEHPNDMSETGKVLLITLEIICENKSYCINFLHPFTYDMFNNEIMTSKSYSNRRSVLKSFFETMFKNYDELNNWILEYYKSI